MGSLSTNDIFNCKRRQQFKRQLCLFSAPKTPLFQSWKDIAKTRKVKIEYSLTSVAQTSMMMSRKLAR